jgi:DNA-binding NtrC family response regulator
MPEVSGEQLLKEFVATHPEVPVIIITGMDQSDIGLKCLKTGAFDFFVKTVGKDELISSVNRALRMIEFRDLSEHLSERFMSDELNEPDAFAEIITQNHRMKSIFRYIEAIKQSPQPLLISGESGTGKELIAKAAHKVSHPDSPFISINIAGLDENVFSDTLFGHVKGAFTGAESDRAGLVQKAGDGVLFLDEIGDLSAVSQTKLLRLLQEREFQPMGSDEPLKTKARFFFATNQDLKQRMAEGTFRKDLYYRIKAHHVKLPPLRERFRDLPLLLNHFIDQAAEALKIEPPHWQPSIIDLLKRYNFPGNIRELSSIVLDAVSQNREAVLSVRSVKKSMGGDVKAKGSVVENLIEPEHTDFVAFFDKLPTLQQVNRILIEEAMRRTNRNQTAAAGLLGISQPSLSRRLKLMNESDNRQKG